MARPFQNHKRRGYRSNSYVRGLTGFGKFQGETVDCVFAYDYAMHSSDTCSQEDGGSSATLVKGPFTSNELFMWRGDFQVENDRVCGTNDRLNRAERRFIKRKVGCVVHESGDGFVSVTWFGTESVMDKSWENIQAYFYGDDDEESEE